VTQLTNRQVVEDFLDLINNHRRAREAFERHVSDRYVQHNPTIADGRESAIALIEGLVAADGFAASVRRMVAEGDLVAVHMQLTLAGGANMAVMDMFRLEGGKIVEHWDVIQEVPVEAHNENLMF
jgi:predicted SnoaL-like aldol condensation-catalyzing enzyme